MGWSKQTGVMHVGTPARSAAAVVPHPPWCTLQAVRGNNHSYVATHGVRASPGAGPLTDNELTMKDNNGQLTDNFKEAVGLEKNGGGVCHLSGQISRT